jgi:flagellar hook-length control protein FliK
MDFIVPPSGTSPPEIFAPTSSNYSSKSEKGASLTFEKVLQSRKAEADDAEEEASTAAAATAAAAILQPVSPVQVQTTGGLSSSEPVSPTTAGSSTPTTAAQGIGSLSADASNTPTQPVTTAGITGFEDLLKTGQSTTDPIGPEDQLVVTPSPLPEGALAAGVTFTEGTGPDGTQQGAVTLETSQAMPVLGQEAKKEPAADLPVEPAKVETTTVTTAVVAPPAQAAKTASNTTQNQPHTGDQSEESSKIRQTVQVKESAPKPDTVASNLGVETTRQVPLTREPALRPEAQAVTLAQQIQEGMEASIRQGKSSIRIQLSPQELGAIDIRLVSGPTGVNMTIIAEHASTGRLLEAQINQLRQNMADAGVQLSNFNINHQSQSGLPNQGNHPQANQQPNANHLRRSFDPSASDESGIALPITRPQRGIDYRV